MTRRRRKAELQISGSMRLRYVEVNANGVRATRLDIEAELRSAMGLAPLARNQLSLPAPAPTASSAQPPRVEAPSAPAREAAPKNPRRKS